METWNRSIREADRRPGIHPMARSSHEKARSLGGCKRGRENNTTRKGVMALTRYTSTLSSLNAPNDETYGLPCVRSCGTECIPTVGVAIAFQHPRLTQ